MNIDYLKVAKRFVKVAVAAGAGYGACYALNDCGSQGSLTIFAPFISAAISAIGNFIKHKYGIKLPF